MDPLHCEGCKCEELSTLRAQLTQVQEENALLRSAGPGAVDRWKREAKGLREQLAQVQAEAGALRKALLVFEPHESGHACVWDRQVRAKVLPALQADAGKGYHHESECQARVDAAVRATWEEAARLVEPEERDAMKPLAAALRARATGGKP